MKTLNGWRIAGRVIGIVALVTVPLTHRTIASGIINGISSGLIWWGIFEFIGWLVDQNKPDTETKTLPQGFASDPSIVLTKAEDVVIHKECLSAKQPQVSADEGARRYREQEHEARLKQEAAAHLEQIEREAERKRGEAERGVLLEKTARESRLKYEQEYTRLCKERAEIWGLVIRSTWKPVSVLLVFFSLCLFAYTFWQLSQATINDAAIRRAKNERQIIEEHKLAAEAQRDTMLAIARGAEAKRVRDLAETDQFQRETEREKARLAYIAAERVRVEAEQSLLEIICCNPLIQYEHSKSSAYALERENSQPGIVVERCRYKIKLLQRMHDEFKKTEGELIQSTTVSENEKLIQRIKLENLYSQRRLDIGNLQTLAALKSWEEALDEMVKLTNADNH